MEHIDITTYKNDLNENITKVLASARLQLISGVVLMLAGLAFTYYIYDTINQSPNHSISRFYLVEICIELMAQVGAIILLISYKGSLKEAVFYRSELIVIRDIDITLKIKDQVSDSDSENITIRTKISGEEKKIVKHKSQKSKIEEQIIETLLNRCSR